MNKRWWQPLAMLCLLGALVACSSGGGDDDEDDGGGGDVTKYTVTVSVSGTGGSATPLSQQVNAGATATFTVTVDSGFQVNVTGDTCTTTASGTTYTTNAINANCTITVSFGPAQYPVTVTVNEGGTVSPSGTVNVAHGYPFDFTFSPNNGYKVATVTGCNGTLLENTNPASNVRNYRTGNIIEACTVTGSFAPISGISGTAAAGAPIIGMVWVKDANGVVANSAIELDGHFVIDTADMTPPLLLNARGTVGGRTVNYHSVAQTTDLGGTINITPFTDLIVANVIGQITQNYFDNPDFADLGNDAVEAARAQLTARLQPVLSAIGLEAGLDLMRESFNTDHTGLDAALDILRFEADPSTNVVTITNVLTNASIEDDVTSASDTEALPAPAAGSIATALSDFEAIMAQFDALAALFATSIPADDAPAYMALFDTATYLEGGSTDPNQMLHDDPGIGWTLDNYSIVQKVDDTHWIISASIFQDGHSMNETAEWHVRNVAGAWKLAGDQQQAYVDAYPGVFRSYWGNSAHFDSHVELDIESFNSDARYVFIEGPGLNHQYSADYDNAVGVIFDLAELKLIDESGNWLRDCADVPAEKVCYTSSELKVGRHYTVTVFDTNKNQIGNTFVRSLKAIPTSAAYAEANQATLFPKITGVTKGGEAVTTLAQATAGGDYTVSWTLPSSNATRCVTTVGLQVTGTAGYVAARNDVLICDSTSDVVTTTVYPGTPDWASAWIWLNHDSGVEYGENLQWQ